MEFYVQTNTKDLEKNLKLKECPRNLQDNFKEVVTDYWDFFVRIYITGLSVDFCSILTQGTIHPSAEKYPGMALVSLRLCEIW